MNGAGWERGFGHVRSAKRPDIQNRPAWVITLAIFAQEILYAVHNVHEGVMDLHMRVWD
jgi:hypothetical protein